MFSHQDWLLQYNSVHPDQYTIQLPLALNQHQAYLPSSFCILDICVDFTCPAPSLSPVLLTGNHSPQPPSPPLPPLPGAHNAEDRAAMAWTRVRGVGEAREEESRLELQMALPPPKHSALTQSPGQQRCPTQAGCSCSPPTYSPSSTVLNLFLRCRKCHSNIVFPLNQPDFHSFDGIWRLKQADFSTGL